MNLSIIQKKDMFDSNDSHRHWTIKYLKDLRGDIFHTALDSFQRELHHIAYDHMFKLWKNIIPSVVFYRKVFYFLQVNLLNPSLRNVSPVIQFSFSLITEKLS